jgi:hypothetical protein
MRLDLLVSGGAFDAVRFRPRVEHRPQGATSCLAGEALHACYVRVRSPSTRAPAALTSWLVTILPSRRWGCCPEPRTFVDSCGRVWRSEGACCQRIRGHESVTATMAHEVGDEQRLHSTSRGDGPPRDGHGTFSHVGRALLPGAGDVAAIPLALSRARARREAAPGLRPAGRCALLRPGSRRRGSAPAECP